jgi:ubiquinone/menaquinone biosynthesis C-methylase UbiE
LRKRVSKTNARILDLCCGVGTSTRSLLKAFPQAETVIGIDASPEMVSMASFLTKHLDFFYPFVSKWSTPSPRAVAPVPSDTPPMPKTSSSNIANARAYFMQGNAENTQLQTNYFDLVTIMYAFHEAPQDGRHRMLQEARRLLAPGGTLAIVDISHDYVPSENMLAGEPYILEYQQNIHRQLQRLKGFSQQSPSYKTLVPGRAGVWLLQRSSSAFA